MNSNVLYAVIAVLLVAAGILAYEVYNDRHKSGGVEIEVGKSGLSIQQK
jgi:hypothetical protein